MHMKCIYLLCQRECHFVKQVLMFSLGSNFTEDDMDILCCTVQHIYRLTFSYEHMHPDTFIAASHTQLSSHVTKSPLSL